MQIAAMTSVFSATQSREVIKLTRLTQRLQMRPRRRGKGAQSKQRALSRGFLAAPERDCGCSLQSTNATTQLLMKRTYEVWNAQLELEPLTLTVHRMRSGSWSRENDLHGQRPQLSGRRRIMRRPRIIRLRPGGSQAC